MDKIKKILMIDDESDTFGPFKVKLEESGYEVLTSDNGIDALEKIKKEKPDLLILDIRMPSLNGEELLLRLRDEEISPGTKVIIATGVSDYGQTQERVTRNFNIAYYLEKPLSIKNLVEKVRLTLEEAKD